MKLVIGVWSANPSIKEIKPKETTAVYQFWKKNVMSTNESNNQVSRRKTRRRL